MRASFVWLAGLLIASAPIVAEETDMMNQVEHKMADSNGVNIHYAALGEGPLVLMIHGFPDFWYSWKHQMDGLAKEYRVAAMDLRGYNKSDKPEGEEKYDMRLLVADVVAVVTNEGAKKATIVGHDWGGAIAWQFAMHNPGMTDKLIIVNLPHPWGMARELATNKEQQKNAQYARNFQKSNSHEHLTSEMLAAFVAKDDETTEKYIEAFENSSFESMMNFYRRNYPKEPYTQPESDPPEVHAPVLQFHGLGDSALHARGLNNTWEHLGADYTLVTIPEVGHWAHHDAAELVTSTMQSWLRDRKQGGR